MSRVRILAAIWVASVIALIPHFLAALADRDFAPLWVAGRLALEGHAPLAYETSILNRLAEEWIGSGIDSAFPYPPIALFVIAPFAAFSYQFAFFLWLAVTGCLFFVTARPYLPRGLAAFFLFLSPAAMVNAQFGQTGFLFAALWLLAFRLPLFAAALTFKPHLGLLTAVETVKQAKVKAVFLIALTIAILSAAVFGIETWRAYLLASYQHAERLGDMASWKGQMTTPLIGYGLVGWALFAGAATFLLWRNFNLFTAATASFLISPYGFQYDMVVVSLGFGLLLYGQWNDLSAIEKLIAGLAYTSPLLVAFGSWLVPPILLAGLFVQARAEAPHRGAFRQPKMCCDTKPTSE